MLLLGKITCLPPTPAQRHNTKKGSAAPCNVQEIVSAAKRGLSRDLNPGPVTFTILSIWVGTPVDC